MNPKQYAIAFSLVWGFLFCAFILLNAQDRKDAKINNTVCWTSFELGSWNSVQTSQKVSRVLLGLRKDGTVVWKEEKMNGNTNISGVMFQ